MVHLLISFWVSFLLAEPLSFWSAALLFAALLFFAPLAANCLLTACTLLTASHSLVYYPQDQ